MSSSYRRSGGGTRSISMRELVEMPFDQLANSVEAATAASSCGVPSVGMLPLLRRTALGGSGGSGRGVARGPRLRSQSSLPLILQFGGTGMEERGLMDLVHTSLRDAAYRRSPFGGDGAGQPGSRTSPRGPHTAADGGGPLGRLPLVLAVALDDLAQPTYRRPYTPGAASEGGRSGMSYNYEQLLALDEERMRRVVRPEVVRALPTVRAKRMALNMHYNQKNIICP
ncbi:hypothetical protein Vretimale_17543 [Volvox reticuliferus]|uniref:Uncharacterized protein n=1 Tax=Volvox reticuliferus TaxID=1737510 RepID=A0A8J4LYK1_9CHLO|nr:hypothetical protein Vretifemale_3426 [Volvox reticuliferus]GIM14732.1 hypothetical protein Vretimale_17543 [Volvox reticuliferus]